MCVFLVQLCLNINSDLSKPKHKLSLCYLHQEKRKSFIPQKMIFHLCKHYSFCSVHLVELIGSGQLFAMKAMDKYMMLNRNKVYPSMMLLLEDVFLTRQHINFLGLHVQL